MKCNKLKQFFYFIFVYRLQNKHVFHRKMSSFANNASLAGHLMLLAP